MTHLVPAAQQMIDQIGDDVEVLDDVDGFGFARSIRLSPAAAKKYGDALEAMDDERIAHMVKSSKGLRITFVADARADHTDPYPIDEVQAVLDEPQ